MLKALDLFVNKHNLIDTSDRILLAVSGGIDSMVMLDLFQKRDANSIAVAHCNFNLRDISSDQDEEFIKNYCLSNDIACFTKSFNTENYANEHGISIQMAARDLRYNWFESLAKIEDFQKIALAQHLDDQTETFFINLIRGTGISGIHGILPISKNIIRPLLFTNRKEIEKYRSENNIIYREDESNSSDKYLRNYIRHNIAPHFENLSPDFSKKLASNIEQFRSVELLYKETVQHNIDGISNHIDGELTINIDEFNKLNSKKLHLFELLNRFGFNRDTIDKVFDLTNKPVSGKYFLSDSHELIINRGQIIIVKNKDLNSKEYSIQENESINQPIELKAELLGDTSISLKTLNTIALLDFNKLEFPLKLRRWKRSDFFHPLGISGKKMLSDYFIDKKYSKIDKAEAWILLSGTQIVWIVGDRIDNNYKITKTTKSIYKLTYSNGIN